MKDNLSKIIFIQAGKKGNLKSQAENDLAKEISSVKLFESFY